MRANMHYKRFGCNVASMNGVNVLKSAIVIGPNNSGKTNFVRIVSDLKKFIFGKNDVWERNLFSSNPIVEIGVSFLENEKEYVFEFKYDTSKKEYIYERLSVVEGEGRKYAKEVDLILRDTIKLQYYIEGTDNSDALRYASKGNILVYTGNADVFPFLSEAKKILHGFASRIDVLNMNSISISKTIDMMKSSDDTNRKIAGFVKNADLFLEDYRYLNDAEASVMYREHDIHHINGVEQIDTGSQDVLIEQMHLRYIHY